MTQPTQREAVRAQLRALITQYPAVSAMAIYVAGRGLPEAPIVGPHSRVPLGAVVLH